MAREIPQSSDSALDHKSANFSLSNWTPGDQAIFRSITPKVFAHGGMLDHNPLGPVIANAPDAKDGKGVDYKGLAHQAALAIEPCTAAGMDPMKNPANPKSPNYDAQKYGPRPAEEIPKIPQDGVIDPNDPLRRLHLWKPEVLPYSGSCYDQQKKSPADLDKIPMY
jgi:hypothetical protein